MDDRNQLVVTMSYELIAALEECTLREFERVKGAAENAKIREAVIGKEAAYRELQRFVDERTIAHKKAVAECFAQYKQKLALLKNGGQSEYPS